MNFKLKRIRFDNPEHYKIFSDIYDNCFVSNNGNSFNLLKNDNYFDKDAFFADIYRGLTTTDQGYVGYINNKPYGVLLFQLGINNHIYLHAATTRDADNMSFFTNVRIIRNAIKYLFRKKGVNKVKARIPIFNKQAEFVLRYVGFAKEGLEKNESSYGGKPVHILLLAITKEDFENNPKSIKQIRKEIKKYIPKKGIKNG